MTGFIIGRAICFATHPKPKPCTRRPDCDAPTAIPIFSLPPPSAVYADFCRQLMARNFIHLSKAGNRKGDLGVFSVEKKGDKIRLIMDTRILNLRFVDPPSTKLPTAAALSALEVPVDSDLFVATGDISNAFYNMRVPDDLSDMFSMPTIRAHYLGVTEPDGAPISPDEILMPCMCVLPMGWPWSLHYCQLVVKNVVEQALGPSRVIEDRRGGIVLSKFLPTAGAAYVGNFAVFGLNCKTVDSVLNALVDGFGKLGLPVHEITPASMHSQFVGLDINQRIVSLKPPRLWKLRQAVRAVLRRRATSGDALRVIAGHLTWAMMTKRESLAVLNAVYRHITGFGSQSGVLSSAARRELWQVSAVLLLLRTDAHAVWDEHAHVCSLREWLVSSVGAPSGGASWLRTISVPDRVLWAWIRARRFPPFSSKQKLLLLLRSSSLKRCTRRPWILNRGTFCMSASSLDLSTSRGARGEACSGPSRTRTGRVRPSPAGCFFLSITCRCASLSLGVDPALVIFFTLSELELLSHLLLVLWPQSVGYRLNVTCPMAHPGGNGRTAPAGAPASPRLTAPPLLPTMPFLKLGQRTLLAGSRLPLAYTFSICLSKPPMEPEPLPST